MDLVSALASSVDGNFTTRLLKYVGGGAIFGVISCSLSEYLDKKSKFINKWVFKLHRAGFRRLGDLQKEPELTKALFLLYNQYLRKEDDITTLEKFESGWDDESEYNEDEKFLKKFVTVLNKTCEICFMAEQIQKGKLNSFVKKIQQGALDPRTDIKLDEHALKIIIYVIKALKTMHLRVRDEEIIEVSARNTVLHTFKEEEKKFEHTKMDLENRKVDLQMNIRQIKAAEKEALRKELEQVEQKLQEIKAPTAPEGANRVLKCDMVDKYSDAIQHALQRIYKFIQKSVERFRQDHPAPRGKKKDVYGIAEEAGISLNEEEEKLYLAHQNEAESEDDEEESSDDDEDESSSDEEDYYQ